MSRRYRVMHGGDEITADLAGDGLVEIDGRTYRVTPAGPGRYRVTDPDGHAQLVALAGPAHATWAVSDGRAVELLVDGSPRRAGASRAADSDMTAPMPATVVALPVAPGDRVEAGAPVVVLEAMKMELTIRASKSGVVRAVRCAVGEIVAPGVPLVEIEG